MTAPADIHYPPTRLKDKVPPTGGLDPKMAVLKALNAAKDLMDSYQGWAVDDLQALWKAFEITEKARYRGADDVRRMYSIAHEIRGQGGTFGFPLITVLGDSLCKFLDRRATLDATDLDVVRIHILAMKAVFRQGLKGDGGPLAAELPKLLLALRTRVESRAKDGA